MREYDFLLKLPRGGFLGLKQNEEEVDGIKVLQIPDIEKVVGIEEIKRLTPKESEGSEEKDETIEKNNKEIDKLMQERQRLYGLTETLINLKETTNEQKQDLKSFCLVATKEVKKECAVTLRTIRLFHKQPIYLICDDETLDYVSQLNIKNLNYKPILNEAYRKKIKRRFFKDRFKDLYTFHKVECIFPKMDAISFALKSQDNTLFVDADIIFLNEVKIESDKEIILGPHYNPANRFYQNFNNGFFNAGYLFCSNKSFPRHWRRLYLMDSRFYEQQGMDYIYEKYDIDIFDKRHNMGWWRNRQDDFEDPIDIEIDGLDIISFHLHSDPDYDFQDHSVVKEKNLEIKNILYNYCKSNAKEKIIEIIEETFK
jgi:hypothetical protein